MNNADQLEAMVMLLEVFYSLCVETSKSCCEGSISDVAAFARVPHTESPKEDLNGKPKRQRFVHIFSTLN